MKKWLITMLVAGCALPVLAEKESVITYEDDWNMYSKFDLQLADLGEDLAPLGGIYAGGLLNNRFILGVGFNSLLGKVNTDSAFLKDLEFMDLWYAGLHTGYIFQPDALIHYSVECLIGGGQLETESVSGLSSSETLFMVQPTLGARINITETFSIGLNAGYLYVDASDTEALKSSDLSGATVGIFLHFTEF